MLKNLFTNKKMLLLITILVLLIVSVIIGVLPHNDSEEAGNLNTNIENETDSNDEHDEDSESSGLEIQEGNEILDDSTKENSTDVPSTLDEEQKDANNKTSNSGNEKNDSDSGNEENDSDSDDGANTDKDNNDSSDEEILEDEKTWGEIF